VVSIIMDGENAWEYFPDNGYHFLSCLYRRLVEHPALELTTFSACLDAGIRPRRIGRLVGGSWVYGNFSTWIGDEGKNRGWDMLVDAKHAYDQALATGVQPAERQQALEAQLAVCEGSDWFWWFGDYNPAETVSDFERLYRLHLANLYQLLQREPPEYLSHSFTRGHGTPRMGGVMRTGGTPAGDQAPGSA
jgi:alpha-amylase/alpha-mannosidase (GH57 family)